MPPKPIHFVLPVVYKSPPRLKPLILEEKLVRMQNVTREMKEQDALSEGEAFHPAGKLPMPTSKCSKALNVPEMDQIH